MENLYLGESKDEFLRNFYKPMGKSFIGLLAYFCDGFFRYSRMWISWKLFGLKKNITRG